MTTKAVLMMTFGSPEGYTFEDIAEFFTNIRRGIRPKDSEIQHLYENYRLIGSSPLQEISRQEAALVQERLGQEYRVYFANKFSRPFIPDVIKQMEADGIEECLCLILEPHYSFYSVMGYEKFIESDQIRFHIIKEWYKAPSLLSYWTDQLREIISSLGNESFQVLFSAHSVPLIALDFEDPYIDQVFDNAHIIAQRLGLDEANYTSTWQSESDIGLPWIKPDVLEYIEEHKDNHPDHYIFLPIAFISEHIEVLFDNDIECKDLCDKYGIGYHRPEMPNAQPALIDALMETIRAHENQPYEWMQPETTTFDELKPSEQAKRLLADSDLKMPEFVRKLIEKKGIENVKIPFFVKQLLKKKGKWPKELE
ncbi:ferrochelatase [Streptococcus oricebi]|uniref:Coproporphyrin III ferrochelatase n=1 Tax=Streptococcus oricebi TaxID=1547447 RepID=A0ABS5B0K3_9STRE|nr:ferrochelatase [Streptococcus oricebi]MBP2622360.1 ferrochelatase [Streptococcus oricebi]